MRKDDGSVGVRFRLRLGIPKYRKIWFENDERRYHPPFLRKAIMVFESKMVSEGPVAM